MVFKKAPRGIPRYRSGANGVARDGIQGIQIDGRVAPFRRRFGDPVRRAQKRREGQGMIILAPAGNLREGQ
jgi:hypothetical protein